MRRERGLCLSVCSLAKLIADLCQTICCLTQKTLWTIRGFGNQLLRTYTENGSGALSWTEDQVWRGTSILANISSSGVEHYTLDHPGSPRLITYDSGVSFEQRFEAFGGGGAKGAGALQFTAHERDSTAEGLPTLDYMHARYYSATNARFLSTDVTASIERQSPQTLNRYSYARNNPLARVDRNGLKDTTYIINLYTRRESRGTDLNTVNTMSDAKYKVKVVAAYDGTFSQVIATRKQMDASDTLVIVHHSGVDSGAGLFGASRKGSDGRPHISESTSGTALGRAFRGTNGSTVFIGCASNEVAQQVQQASGTPAAGTQSGIYTHEGVDAAYQYALTWSRTGSAEAALDAANAALKTPVCINGVCEHEPYLQPVAPDPQQR